MFAKRHNPYKKALSQLNSYINYLQYTLLNEQAAYNVWQDALETRKQLSTVAKSYNIQEEVTKMDAVLELQTLREELIREIDEKINQMIEKLQQEQQETPQRKYVPARNYESIYPLNIGTGIFKGKRPTGVIFPNGERAESPTWKRVMEEILLDCCKDPAKRQMLLNLRGKILGRNRVLLGSETGKMHSPVKIMDALYVETHYDAETLLRILTTRILDEVGYDYSRIQVAVKTE